MFPNLNSENTPEVEVNKEHEKLLIEKKAEIEKKLNQTVLAWIIPVSETDNAFLFMRRPNALIKRRAIDKMAATQEIAQTGKYLIDSCMLKEESDKRFQDENNPDNADLINTACISVMDEIRFYSGVIKKK